MAGALLLTNAGDFVDFGTTESTTALTVVLDGTQLTNAVLGDMIVALVHNQAGTTTATTAPTNWIRTGGANDAAQVRQTGVYYYLVDSSAKLTALAANHTWTFASGGRTSCTACRATGIALLNPVDAAAAAFSSVGTASSLAAASVTTVTSNALLVGVSHRQNSSGTNNLVSSMGSMATHERRTSTSTAISTTATVVGWQVLSSSGATGTVTVTYPANCTAMAAELIAFRAGDWQGNAAPTATAAVTVTATRSDAGSVTATTTATITATASTGGASGAVTAATTNVVTATATRADAAAATVTTAASVTATAATGTTATATASTTASVTVTAAASGATLIIGTPIERTSAQTLTVPTGVTSAMVGLFVFTTGSGAALGTSFSKSGATFTQLDARTATNTTVTVIKGVGLVAGDTIAISQTTNGSGLVTSLYQDQYDYVPSSLSAAVRGSSVATCVSGSVTPVVGQRVVVIASERTTATGTTVSSATSSGGETLTQDTYSGDASSTATASSTYLGSFIAASAVAETATVTFNSASSNGYAATVLTAPFVVTAAATAATTAAVTAIAGNVVAAASGAITASVTATAGFTLSASAAPAIAPAVTATANTSSPAWVYPLGYTSVTAMLADAPNIRVAHRGGDLDWPEMSFYAYQQSVNWGVDALEVSLARTLDGRWFGLHDATLDRTSGLTAGTNLAPSTLTWAQIQASYSISAALPSGQTAKPYMLLDEVVKAFGRTHVLFLDPKNDTANIADLLDQLKALYDGSDSVTATHVVIKMYGVSGTAVPTACAARGIKTWGYFYEADSANFAGFHARWDTLGLDYQASSGSWSTFIGYGQPVLGHIIPSAAALTAALAFGASGAMVSGIVEAIPLSGGITSTVVATAARSGAAAATSTVTAAVTATAAATTPAAASAATTAVVVATAALGSAASASITCNVVATANVSSPAAVAPSAVSTVVATAARADTAAMTAPTAAAVIATAVRDDTATSAAAITAAATASAALEPDLCNAASVTVVTVTATASTVSPAAVAATVTAAIHATATGRDPGGATSAVFTVLAAVIATAVRQPDVPTRHHRSHLVRSASPTGGGPTGVARNSP